jgi:GNAT superfamily N-acetyltransferase
MELAESATEIVYASSSDVEQIAPLFDMYRVWYGQTSDLDAARSFLLQRLRNNESVVFLARQDDRPVGFAQLYPLFSSVSMQPVWVLNDLFVVDDARQQGIGSQLLETAAEFARELGAIRLELATAPDNQTAQAVYEKLGWKPNTEFIHYTLPVN